MYAKIVADDDTRRAEIDAGVQQRENLLALSEGAQLVVKVGAALEVPLIR